MRFDFWITSILPCNVRKLEFSYNFYNYSCRFDLLDGRVARLLKSTSNFGMYLDSLSDFVVFGTIPPITIYFWMGGIENKYLWIVVVLFIICSALRLARFNSELSDKPNYAKIILVESQLLRRLF